MLMSDSEDRGQEALLAADGQGNIERLESSFAGNAGAFASKRIQ